MISCELSWFISLDSFNSLTYTVRIFGTDRVMEFGLKKSATVATNQKEVMNTNRIKMLNGQIIWTHQDVA